MSKAPKHADAEYLAVDPFFGDDATLACHTVKLVTTRKPHPCYFGMNGDRHQVPAGERARYERALVDGDLWGTYYMCLPCLDGEIAELNGDNSEKR